MANPLVKIAVTGAGVAAGIIGNKLVTGGWSAAFGEDAPTAKTLKASAKATKAARKEAKKAGAGKAELQAIRDPQLDQPVWKGLLWLLLSGVAITAFRELAKKGAAVGTEKLTARRPRPNRG